MHENKRVTRSKTMESLAGKRISYTANSLHLSCVPPPTTYEIITNFLLELECLQLILFDRQPIFGQHELPKEFPCRQSLWCRRDADDFVHLYQSDQSEPILSVVDLICLGLTVTFRSTTNSIHPT